MGNTYYESVFRRRQAVGQKQALQYAYCANNPVNYIDRTGCDTTYANIKGDIYATLQGGENIVVVSEPLPEVTITGEKPKSDAAKVMEGTLKITGLLAADDVVGGEFDDAAIPFVLVGGTVIATGMLLYEELNSPSPPILTYPQTDNPSQETPHYKDDAQHGRNNVGLEPEELESLQAKQKAGTLTPSERNKLKANEKNEGQRRSRQSKDKKQK